MRIGGIQVDAISDGTFLARPSYFGADVAPTSRPDLFNRDRAAWLPIGCFLIRMDGRVVLVDAGLGPQWQELPSGMQLVGGQLLTGLRALGVAATEITDVVCTHLHSDHVGWLFDLDAKAVFPEATIWFGVGDWDHFVTGSGDLLGHIRAGFRAPANAERLRPIDVDTAVAPGVTALLTPGHTPGHICVAVSGGQQRLLLVGDAITCPVQLVEPSWHSMGDVEPALADRTRDRLWRELEDDRTTGVGAHFPELQFGRVRPGAVRTWCSE
jgi:glyoxylase-like metal-dependent hydrolase (beta-lactamase superfamily II)